MPRNPKEHIVLCPLCGKTKVARCDICEVCSWEYDPLDAEYPDEDVGYNNVSLNEGKQWFAKHGRYWYRVLHQKLCEHYGGSSSEAFQSWCDDESGWQPEP